MRARRGLGAVMLPVLAGVIYAQTAPKPQFEVASIKRNVSLTAERGGGFQPGGRFLMTRTDVRNLVRIAYRSGPVLFPSQIIGGPDWSGSEQYDIEAKVDSELARKTPAELSQIQPLLLQSLLEDRFKVRVHREIRNQSRYALVVVRNDGKLGPQLKPSRADCGGTASSNCATVARQGIFTSGGTAISSLSNYLASSVVHEVVVDRTGLQGRFEIQLEWLPDQSTSPLAGEIVASDKPSIFRALQEQLGLELKSERGPVEVYVIDHVEKPTEN
jgi:uncharacterized protein (TIGR03435 family)